MCSEDDYDWRACPSGERPRALSSSSGSAAPSTAARTERFARGLLRTGVRVLVQRESCAVDPELRWRRGNLPRQVC